MAPFPILLADIGGTFARFALLEGPGQPFRLLTKEPTTAHADPVSAIVAALRTGAKPASALLAAAGRVTGLVVRLTNANWTIDAEQIGRHLGLDRVTLLNDYAATAAVLASLAAEGSAKALRIGPNVEGAGPQIVLGPGTGLGAAAAIPFGRRLVIHSTEAGHIEFGASTAEEVELWPLLEHPRGRLSAENILSGPGLVRIYRALARTHGIQPRLEGPAEIVAAGCEANDTLAAETLRFFVSFLGRFAGDLALIFGATGGVFIAGGIAPRISSILSEGPFRIEFERKSPFDGVMRQIPTRLMTAPEPVLEGLSVIAAQPRRYMMQTSTWLAAPAPSRDRD